MNPNRYKSFREATWAILIFMGMALYQIKDIIFSSGLPLGNDWGIPLTQIQLKVLSDIVNSTWQFNNLIPHRNWNLSTATFFKLCELLSRIGIYGDTICKLLMFFVFSFAGYSLYSLLRSLKVGYLASVMGGLILMTTPIFFNFTIMGWMPVLLIVGLIPLALKYFILCVQDNDWRKSIFISFLFSIGFWQSQALVWFTLSFLLLSVVVVKDKKSFYSYSGKFIFIMGAFFLLNQHILLPLLVSPDPAVHGSKYVQTSTSMGTIAHFYPLNIIRLFGGLFNFQYETVMEKQELLLSSWILPLFAFFGLFSKKPRRIKLFFLLLSLIPFFMFCLNNVRFILQYIPFSNIIRDFARFTIFSCLGYSALAALFFDEFFSLKNSWKKFVLLGVFLSLQMVALVPWWTNGIIDYRRGRGSDNRLSTKVFNEDYFLVEEFLSRIELDGRALFWPVGGFVEFIDDPGFRGAFHEAADIFALYSPIPGGYWLTDRKPIPAEVENAVLDAFRTRTLSSWIGNLRYVVVRKDCISGGKWIDHANLSSELSKWLDLYYSTDRIDVYRTRTFSPHFFIPRKIIYSDIPMETLKKRVIQGHPLGPKEIIIDSVLSREKEYQNLRLNDSATIEFRKVNPTQYAVRIIGTGPRALLGFHETYHQEWKLSPTEFKNNVDKLDGFKIINNQISDPDDAADRSEITSNFDNGYLTVPKGIKQLKFISKNMEGVIQNNNIQIKPPLFGLIRNYLPEDNHIHANGFINGWLIEAEDMCNRKMIGCQKNSDGTYNVTLLVEYAPQRVFFLGALIAMTTFGCGLIFIFYSTMRRRKKSK